MPKGGRRQLGLVFRASGRGGWRPNAGRPRSSDRVAHGIRPPHARSHPVHVTLRVRSDVPRLRRGHAFAALRVAFRGGRDRFGFRLVHYSVQSSHLHLICEADDRRALSRGMQGLAIRMAKRLNRAVGRRGSVFADRYHARALTTPRETRLAMRYVLLNHVHHGSAALGPDIYSSGPTFDGWKYAISDMLIVDASDGTHPRRSRCPTRRGLRRDQTGGSAGNSRT